MMKYKNKYVEILFSVFLPDNLILGLLILYLPRVLWRCPTRHEPLKSLPMNTT